MAVTPVAGGAALTALSSVVQDLARFFLSLSGSSSLGAIGGIAGVTASAAGLGGAVCPPTDAGGAVTTCTEAVMPAGAGVSPAAPAAVPGMSGEQQRQVESRSRGRRSRSSSDGTDRRAKKRARRRSPSPGPSSRRRGRHYRSSLDSSEEDRADASPPRSGRAHGGTPGGARSSRAYDRSPRPGTSRSYARDDRYRSGGSRRSPAPSGAADDDRSSAFESVDFDRDDSFRSVLGLIRSFHGMEEPAGVPSARCKTSLASAYGLMSEVSLAFTLPASPLVRSLLDDTNIALAKFLEDQTVHGFLPVPGRRHRRYYRTSSSSFPGPYTVPPGVTSITLEKVSEAKKRSVALSASQVSSMEAMLSGMCEVLSLLDWWLSTCGGFRDHLPVEVRADFERLMIFGSRALEFLASQGCTTLGNLVLARRDSLLADVRSTVPAEEIARLRYSPLPETASIFPHLLLDSALLKMRAAASDALVQRTLHPPRISRKPAAAGQSGGSSTAASGQAGTSGARQAQKQSSGSSPSGQSGQRKKKGKSKAPFSSSSRGPGRSGGKGKGAGKKSARRGDSLCEGWGLPGTALGAVAGSWSRDLGGDRPSGQLPCPVQGLSSSPISHSGIVSDVPGRLSSGSSLAARGRGDACQRSLRNRPRSGSWPLQSHRPGGEGDWRLETHDRSLTFERLCPADAVQDGNSRFGAPQVFTRVFAAVSAWAHSRGIRLLCYLDDWLVLSSSEKKAKQSVQALLSICHTLGIVINEKKSDLVPSQAAKHLGMTIDTGAGKVFPSLARVEKFLSVAERFCAMESPPAQLW